MDGFFLKKFVAGYLQVIPLTLELLFLGLIFIGIGALRRKKRGRGRGARSFGFTLVILAGVFLYLCSIDPVATSLLRSLERRYASLKLDDNMVEALDPEYIVILAAGYEYAEGKPITSQLSGITVSRLVEGVRVSKAFPEAKVILTGGAVKEEWPSAAELMAELGELLGLEAGELVMEIEARDTYEHAVNLRDRLMGHSFIVVTSGFHMHRAMGLFQGQGLTPVAAPADLRIDPAPDDGEGFRLAMLAPRYTNVERCDLVFHEWLGLMWAGMQGHLDKENAAADDAETMEL